MTREELIETLLYEAMRRTPPVSSGRLSKMADRRKMYKLADKPKFLRKQSGGLDLDKMEKASKALRKERAKRRS